ncbi:unnamed protein product, partial [Symbiodinium microadriaticum]
TCSCGRKWSSSEHRMRRWYLARSHAHLDGRRQHREHPERPRVHERLRHPRRQPAHRPARRQARLERRDHARKRSQRPSPHGEHPHDDAWLQLDLAVAKPSLHILACRPLAASSVVGVEVECGGFCLDSQGQGQQTLLGCIVMAVAIAILAMLAEVMAEATSSTASLRGASAVRELQQTPADQVPVRDSDEAVAPRCLPGYVDVTGGQAFFWSCAFHCDGGQYYATAGCMCACLTPEQRDRLESQGDAGFTPGGTGTGQSSGILITARSTIGPPPAGDPVVEIPVGPFGGDGRPGVAPPAVDSYVMKQDDQPIFQAETSPEEEGNLSLAVIALIGGLLLVIAAAVALICALWSSIAHGKPRRTKVMVQLPRFSPHVPVEKCPQPPAELRSTASAPTLAQAVSLHKLQEPAIRVSWNSSNVSGESQGPSRPAQWQHLRVPDGDRKLKGSPSSKTSATSTCSGGASGTSSLSSGSWATKSEQGGRPQLGFSGKTSRVHPSARQVFM